MFFEELLSRSLNFAWTNFSQMSDVEY